MVEVLILSDKNIANNNYNRNEVPIFLLHFYGSRRLLIMLKIVCHRTLSRVSWILSTALHHI
jgi:hypothetical protein